ncbi:MAG: LacI family DNA-binding transcriptional regulator [Acidimicrobiales bacterium]|nr:LacI family DNA-binding transcriptional regulator [Acidimicrobiales bacterium]
MSRGKVTIADVAERAGVNASTVSRVVNGTASLSPDTTARVQRAIAELGYRPNRAARHLAGGRTGAIGIVVPDLTNPFFATIVRGAQHAAHDAGELTLVADSESRGRGEVELSAMLARDVDGLVLCSPTSPAGQLRGAVTGRPAVLVNRQARGWPSVVADQAQAVEVAFDDVRSQGHERIAYVRGPSNKWTSSVRDRVAARLGAVLVGPFAPTFAGGAEAAEVLDDDVTAVITHNDLMAVGLIDALLRKGRRVPRDLSVLGCDDIEIAALTRPRLTSVAMPLEELGATAVGLLLDLIARPAPDVDSLHRTLPVWLVARDSTARPK